MVADNRANPSGQFRRKFPRRSFKSGVGFLYDGKYQVGQGLEIGEGGLSLLLNEIHQTEKDIVLSFQIPHGEFVVIRAEIKTCRRENGKAGFVHGCAFKGLVFDRKREIRSYVSARDN